MRWEARSAAAAFASEGTLLPDERQRGRHVGPAPRSGGIIPPMDITPADLLRQAAIFHKLAPEDRERIWHVPRALSLR
jgi:hypothetical protein